MAGSCIGVILLVMLLELLRRSVKEYDRFLLRKHVRDQSVVTAPKDDDAKGGVAVTEACVVAQTTYRPTVLEQAVRALLHTCQFAVAYFVMLYVDFSFRVERYA